MTNQEAIKILKSKMDGTVDTSYEWAETIRLAIKALEQEPYFWEKCPYYEPDMMFDGKDEYDMGKCTYKQEPKTGHWIADVFIDECSVCGEQTLFFEDQQKNYCPNCGAKMVEPQEDEKTT